MTVRTITLWILLLSVTGAQDLYAAENRAPNTGQPSPETVQQKLRLVKTLLAKSPALERAARSDDAAVKQQTATAHTLYTNANDALSAGNTSRADELLDEALQLIENVTRRAPDPLQVEKELLKRYTELLNGVHNLLAAYHDLRLRLSPKTAISSEPERVPNLIEQAQTLARDHHYREAGKLMETAHAEVIDALNQLLKSTALMYDLKFKSPVEEFDYEMARYLSYEELVPIAYVELKPGEDSIKLSERYVQESREMKDLAKQRAANGDLKSATDTLLEAIKHLQTALRMVGLVLPE